MKNHSSYKIVYIQVFFYYIHFIRNIESEIGTQNLFGLDSSFRLIFTLATSLSCIPLIEINNKNCCRLKEKCRVVQLIYSEGLRGGLEEVMVWATSLQFLPTVTRPPTTKSPPFESPGIALLLLYVKVSPLL